MTVAAAAPSALKIHQQAVAGNLPIAAPDHASVVAPPGKGNAGAGAVVCIVFTGRFVYLFIHRVLQSLLCVRHLARNHWVQILCSLVLFLPTV